MASEVGSRILAFRDVPQGDAELGRGGFLDPSDESRPIADALVERRRTHADLGRDGLHRERVEAAGLEETGRGVEDRLVGGLGSGGTHRVENRLLTLALQGYNV